MPGLTYQPVTDEVVRAILDGTTHHIARVDIYDADQVTPWMLDAPIIDGSISVDNSRDERRTMDLTLENIDNDLAFYSDGFWYDKVLKPYRGVVLDNGETWQTQLGEFRVDTATEAHFPHQVVLSCRDYTAFLMDDEFGAATTFAQGQALEEVIRAIALNAGILKYNLPATGVTLPKDYTFEGGAKRWDAIKTLATETGYEVYFDRFGYLVMNLFPDPAVGSPIFTFETGDPDGSIVSYEKVRTRGRMKNKIVVYGSSEANSTVYAEASLPEDSPVSRLGTLTGRIGSGFVTTEAEALALAQRNLKVAALEDYNLNLETLVIPWLDANNIVGFEDPRPDPDQPTRFLLTNFSIPLQLGTMNPTAKRISLLSTDLSTDSSGGTAPDAPTTGKQGSVMGLSAGELLVLASTAEAEADLAYIKSLGFAWVRFNVDWNRIEASQGVFNWSTYDRLVAAAQSQGLKVLAIAQGAPSWANGGNSNQFYPPTAGFYDEFATYAAGLADRGADAVEIWNEPNNAAFWRTGPNATDYADLVIASYAAIKAVNPDCLVIAGATSPAAGALSPASFLTSCLAVSGFSDAYDHWSHHPYQMGSTSPLTPLSSASWNSCQQLRTIWQIQTDAGITRDLWATEFGSPTGGTVGPYEVDTEAAHKQRMTDYYDAFLQMEAEGIGIGERFAYSIRDAGAIDSASMEDHFGSMRNDYSEKPVGDVHRSVAAQSRA